MKKSLLPNFMTALRIVLSVPLFFAKRGTVLFCLLYCFICLSDVLDGYFARRFHAATAFGAAFDTVADMVFFGVLFRHIVAAVGLYRYEWVAVGVVFTVKIVNILLGYRLHHRFIALHTTANRVTGLLFVAIGFTSFSHIIITLTILSAVYAAVEECYRVLYNSL